MLEPKAEGDFEDWASLEATLLPFLREQVGALFLPWSEANAQALAAGQDHFELELDGHRWEQKPQKYHAKSLAALRARYRDDPKRDALDPVLDAAGCLALLQA